MKKALLTILILIGCLFGAYKLYAAVKVQTGSICIGACGLPSNIPYKYGGMFTINNASSTQSNFPVEVSFNGASINDIQNPGLKNVLYGGAVTNSQGFDIVFSTSSTASGLLPFQTELYTPTTGQLVAWVNVPTVANTQTFYMFYGNPSITTFQGGAASGMWNSNYSLIYHFSSQSGLSLSDSTNNANNGTITGTVTSIPGQVDGAANMGNSGYVTSGSNVFNPASTTAFSASAWIFATSTSGSQAIISQTSAAGPWIRSTSGTFQTEIGVAGAGGTFTDSLTTNAWNYIVFQQNGTSANLYVNGVIDPTTVTVTPASNTNGSIVGAGGSGGQKWPGIIDETRISKTTFSPQWIATEYNNQSNPNTFYKYAPLNQTGAITIKGN